MAGDAPGAVPDESIAIAWQPVDVQPVGLTPEDAAALYRWATEPGRPLRGPDDETRVAIWRALRFLAVFARDELKPVALADLDALALGPFARGSETSRRAAVEAYPRQGSQRHRVIWCLYRRLEDGRNGATRDELAAELGMSPNTVRPRVVELLAGGWIERAQDSPWDVDETRRTKLGREAEVLVLTGPALVQLNRERGIG